VALRPYDWSPLGLDSDPVPGNPETVSAESRRLGQTAQELRTQITMLQQIASDATLKGQYAGTLRAHAQQLSQDLGKVATRYESTADATDEWSGNLAEAQAASLSALRAAESPYEQLRRLQAPPPPAASASAAAQQQYATDKQQYQQAQSSAQAALTDAQRLLGQATTNRDTTGAAAARKISDASHDSLADSWWDQFKQMISGIANNLKTIATVIGYIATACAILAVILTGPLALVFLLLAGGLLLTELGIHTVLAATGNGSWVDVGLDVAALATLGYGGALDASAESLEKTAEDASVEDIVEDHPLTSAIKGLVEQATGLKEEALKSGYDELSPELDNLTEMTGKLKNDVYDFAKGVAKEKIEGVAKEAEESRSSVFDVMKDLGQHGSRGTGNAFNIAAQLAKRFPENSQIVQVLKSLKVVGTKNAINLLSGTTVDAVDKTLSLTSGPYNHFKDSLSGALPAAIGIPVVEVAQTWAPTDFILHTTEFASK
jgi:hypothetical protein